MSTSKPASPPPLATVVSVGNELLLGQTIDTNGTWLAEELSGLGLEVTKRWTIGDDEGVIRNVVTDALGRWDAVVITGGLGPTHDDRTRYAVAGALGLSLIPDQDLIEGLHGRFRARGFETTPEGAEEMALVPEGGVVFPNPHGAAPGLAVESPEGGVLILLPGVPGEMRGIFAGEVRPFLEARFSGRLKPAVHRVIHTFGVPESVLMAELRGRLPAGPRGVSLAFLPDQVGVRLRLTVRQEGTAADAQAELDRFEELLSPVLAKYRFEATSGDLAEAVGRTLLKGGHTLGVAESCTGGLVAKRVTDTPGSSRFFQGGIVAYGNEVKETLLGVPRNLILEHGVVSGAVAEAMALGVARALGTSVGVGVTGIAGPGGGSREKPVGTVYMASSINDRTTARKELFLGDREAIRARAAHATLGHLLRRLQGREG